MFGLLDTIVGTGMHTSRKVGRWKLPHAHAVWVAPKWEHRKDGYVMQKATGGKTGLNTS